MPKLWMYLPWPDDQKLTDAAFMFIDRMKRMERSTYRKANLLTKEYLNVIENDDSLYITGECDKGIDFIGSRHKKTLSAGDLADHFVGNLNVNHKSIHIWACYSGYGLSGDPGARSGLAYSFWKAMRERGFKKLTVYGYRMAVMDPLEETQENLFAAEILPGFTGVLSTPDKYVPQLGNVNNWKAGIDPDGKIIPPIPLLKPASLPVSAD